MREIRLHISEDIRGVTGYGTLGITKPITVSLGTSNNNASLLSVSVNSPQGFSMSSVQSAAVVDVLSDTYEYILGSPTFSVSGTNAAIIAMLSESERVSKTLPYKED